MPVLLRAKNLAEAPCYRSSAGTTELLRVRPAVPPVRSGNGSSEPHAKLGFHFRAPLLSGDALIRAVLYVLDPTLDFKSPSFLAFTHLGLDLLDCLALFLGP